MGDWTGLNDLIQNAALLIAGVTILTFTYGSRRHPTRCLSLRYMGFVVLGWYLMFNGLHFTDGLRFDFRGVIVALVAWRYGVLPALLVALPLAAYRISLGGQGTVVAVIHMALLAAVAGRPAGWIQLHPGFQDEPLGRRWWRPFAIFAPVNLIFFPAFALAGRPLEGALPIYTMTTLMSAVGFFLAFEVKHSRLRTLALTTHLRRLASADSLTGCLNRRQFDTDLAQITRPAHLLLLDIDLFRRINDTYGHDAGDRVLVALGEVLRAAVRPTDRVYRLGGEEFAVLFQGGAFRDAEHAAERIRQTAEHALAGQADLPGEHITLSGGLVTVGKDPQQVLKIADDLLYTAKQDGRNCTASQHTRA